MEHYCDMYNDWEDEKVEEEEEEEEGAGLTMDKLPSCREKCIPGDLRSLVVHVSVALEGLHPAKIKAQRFHFGLNNKGGMTEG